MSQSLLTQACVDPIPTTVTVTVAVSSSLAPTLLSPSLSLLPFVFSRPLPPLSPSSLSLFTPPPSSSLTTRFLLLHASPPPPPLPAHLRSLPLRPCHRSAAAPLQRTPAGPSPCLACSLPRTPSCSLQPARPPLVNALSKLCVRLQTLTSLRTHPPSTTFQPPPPNLSTRPQTIRSKSEGRGP